MDVQLVYNEAIKKEEIENEKSAESGCCFSSLGVGRQGHALGEPSECHSHLPKGGWAYLECRVAFATVLNR